MSMLLSYNKQYYSLVHEVTNKFDEHASNQVLISRLKNRLVKLNAPLPPTHDRNLAMRQVEEKVQSIGNLYSNLFASIKQMTNKTTGRIQQPIKSYVISHKNYSIPNKMVALFAGGATLAASILHFIFFTLRANINRKEREEGKLNVPFFKLDIREKSIDR